MKDLKKFISTDKKKRLKFSSAPHRIACFSVSTNIIPTLQKAWDYAKKVHGSTANESNWLEEMNSEILEELGKLHEKAPECWSIEKLVFSLIKE